MSLTINASIFAIVPEFASAHEALLGFYDIMEMSKFKERHAALSDWIDKYTACDIPPVRQAAFSISKHRQGIGSLRNSR